MKGKKMDQEQFNSKMGRLRQEYQGIQDAIRDRLPGIQRGLEQLERDLGQDPQAKSAETQGMAKSVADLRVKVEALRA